MIDARCTYCGRGARITLQEGRYHERLAAERERERLTRDCKFAHQSPPRCPMVNADVFAAAGEKAALQDIGAP